MLSYDMEKPMSEEEFFDCCASILTEKDFITIKNTRLVPLEEKPSNPVLEKWNNWERSLRNELVKMRAAKKGQDSEKHIAAGGLETGVLEIAREAFQAATPLDAESVLNKARWDYLEMLEAGHYFDIGKVIIYFLKVQILQRKLQINKEKGKIAFAGIYDVIHDNNSAQENR